MPQGLESEVDQNFEIFMQKLSVLLPKHRDEWALMRHGEVIDFFPQETLALKTGRERYADGLYSIQEVTDRPVDLGFFSHAINTRIA